MISDSFRNNIYAKQRLPFERQIHFVGKWMQQQNSLSPGSVDFSPLDLPLTTALAGTQGMTR